MTFEEFYLREYRTRHADPVCRWFHVVGLVLSAILAGVVVWVQLWWLLLLLPVPTSLLGWLGHLIFQKKPTFFEHPIWSSLGFWGMIGEMPPGRFQPQP